MPCAYLSAKLGDSQPDNSKPVFGEDTLAFEWALRSGNWEWSDPVSTRCKHLTRGLPLPPAHRDECAIKLSAVELELRLILKMSGAAFFRNSRNGKSSKTVTIHSAKSSKAWMVLNSGVLLLARPDRLSRSMANGAPKNRGEGDNIKFWNTVGATTQSRMMDCALVFGVASSWIQRTNMKTI